VGHEALIVVMVRGSFRSWCAPAPQGLTQT